MPVENPPTKQAFLDQVSTCSWSNNHLVTHGTLLTVHPYVQASPYQWAIGSEGLLIGSTTYSLLKGATANSDGTFTPAGAVDPLRLAIVDGWAKEAPK